MCQPPISHGQRVFGTLHKARTENLANPDFTINQLSRELALSRTIFYEKLKALTGQAPNEFIKLIRMTEAANPIKTTGSGAGSRSFGWLHRFQVL